jgi:hypothetical protein
VTSGPRPAALAAALALAALAAAGPASALSWEEAAAAGARIRAIVVVRDDVFDLSSADESHALGRAANFVHVVTAERVVRDALLIRAGDPADPALVRESERRLRALPWILGAEIVPVAAGPGAVDALVRTHDGWSLSLSVKYNHAGGDDLWRVWVEEQNLLGLGKEVLVSREQDLERTTTELSYKDPLLLGSAWRLELAAQDLSDGKGRRLLLARPFARLDDPWGAGVEYSRRELTETQYNHAEAVYRFPATLLEARAYATRKVYERDRTAVRAGLEYRVSEASYGELTVESADELPPPSLDDRRLHALLVTGALVQDRYRVCRNLKAIGCVEDVNVGWEAAAAAGWSGPALGGAQSAAIGEASASTGWAPGEATLVLGSASAHGRLEDGRGEDVLVAGRLTLYDTRLPRQTIAVDLDAAAGRRLDPEHLLYLGGFEGLRGYPNHFRGGEGRWLLSAEDRVITPWRLWGIAQVGFVAYVDAGGAAAPAGGWTRTYADCGAGLRFGNLKGTTSRVVTLTVAFPLVHDEGVSDWQVVVGNVLRF